MTTILHKRGKGIPEADQFESVGEILIDTDTGIAYTLTDGGDVTALGGDVDLSACVKLEAATQYMRGEWNALEWSGGAYPMLRIGEASTSGIGVYDSPIYLETDNGIYSFNNFAFLITGGKIQGKNGSTIVGFDSVQAGDFLDANGDSIVGGEEFDGTVESPLIVDGTGNSDYNKARVTAKLKSSIEQEFNLTFESRQLQNYGEWYQRKAPSLYIEDEGADEINQSTPTDLGNYNHPFGEGWFSGPIRAADYLDADGNSIIGAGGGDSPIELDIIDQGEGKTDYNFWLQGIGRENEEFPYPQFQYQGGEEYTTLLFNEGIFNSRFKVMGEQEDERVIEMGIWDEQITAYKPIQAPDFLDADGNSIVGVGGGDPEWAFVSNDYENVYLGYGIGKSPSSINMSVAVGHMSDANENGVGVGWRTQAADSAIAVGSDAKAQMYATTVGGSATAESGSIALGYNAKATKQSEFAISSLIKEVNFSNATVQATDYLDANGDSIIGGGGDSNHTDEKDNVVIGELAMPNPTEASRCTAVGYYALNSHTSKMGLTGIGYRALNSNDEGEGNTATGCESMRYSTSGNYNTANGWMALRNNKTGDNNTAVGYLALNESQQGSGNTAIGAGADIEHSFDGYSNATAVGYNAKARASNTVQLGNTSVTTVKSSGTFSGAAFRNLEGDQMVSSRNIVEAFTALQTAVADEDTVEGIRTALTNALGGLIEKFEGMAK